MPPESPDLRKVKQISAIMGSDPLLIQASGGNTSLKENGLLWVKASGKYLGDALNEDIFLAVDLDVVLKDTFAINQGDSGLQIHSRNGLRPSIETSLHAHIPHQVVLHSHPIDIISISLLPYAEEVISKALIDIDWCWIPYKRPGKPLTHEIIKIVNERRVDVFILANHGLVVGGTSPDEAAAIQEEVISRLRQTVREYTSVNTSELSKRLTSIHGAYMPKASVIHSLAIDPWSLEMAQQNPAYPDHVVFCGVSPWVVGVSDMPPSGDTKYGLIPGVGVFLLAGATAATEAMLQAQAEIFLRIPAGERVNLLNEDQCNELLSWEAEKYRQKLVKSL